MVSRKFLLGTSTKRPNVCKITLLTVKERLRDHVAGWTADALRRNDSQASEGVNAPKVVLVSAGSQLERPEKKHF